MKRVVDFILVGLVLLLTAIALVRPDLVVWFLEPHPIARAHD